MRLTTWPNQIVCKAPLLGGGWCKVEISHEKEGEKFTLAMSVGGQEVGRLATVSPILSNMTDVKIYIGKTDGNMETWKHGNIRGLVVLDKP